MLQGILERASAAYQKKLPFVLYSKPNSSVLQGVFQGDDELIQTNDFTRTGFIFAPYDLEELAILLRLDDTVSVEFDASDFEPKNDVLELLTTLELNQDANLGKSGFIACVENAIAAINEDELNKVVLSRKIEVQNIKPPIDLFKNLLAKYPNAFSYLWYHPKVGTWMGATPEILVKTHNTKFITMSLAGTQVAAGDKPPSWTQKEYIEQQLVTDYITDLLKNQGLSFKIEAVESIKAGNLWHLRSKISGTYPRSNFDKLLKALHPTPAVCGTPKANAVKFINDNESYRRTFYTGFLGELNFKKEIQRNKNTRNRENSAYVNIAHASDLFVNLRCMELKKDKVYIYVGGGITQSSVPEKEWEETVNKSITMLRVLEAK